MQIHLDDELEICARCGLRVPLTMAAALLEFQKARRELRRDVATHFERAIDRLWERIR